MDPITIAMALAQFAPSVIKYITGSDKAAAAAGKVVEIAQIATGKPTGDTALAAIQADPTLALQFRQAVMANEADLDKAFLADRENARQRDVQLAQAGFRNRRADYMVALDVVGLVGCLLVLVFFRASIPGEVVGILSTIAGIFGACLRDAHQFEFGSSRSSQQKDETIRDLAK